MLGGEAGGSPTSQIWRFEPGKKACPPRASCRSRSPAGAATAVGSTAYLIGGTGAGEAPPRDGREAAVEREAPPRPEAKAQAAGNPPFSGQLLIADRGNNRLLVVNAEKHILWRFPSPAHPAPPGGFYFPDDAFFIHGGNGIISNEEQNERIVQLSYPGGKLLWSYGHPGRHRLRTRLPPRARRRLPAPQRDRHRSPTRRTAGCC